MRLTMVITALSLAACTETSTVMECQLLEIETACVSPLGEPFGGPLSLDFEDVSARTSSLQGVAGSYDHEGDVLTINSACVFFEPCVQSGCVINGQASVVDADWNLYGATVSQ